MCFALPPAAARHMIDFVFHPASYIHPDRNKLHIPADLTDKDVSPAFLSQILLTHLDLGDDVALDVQNSAHRAALLPASVLEALALRLGLYQQSQRIKLVILRSELELMQKHLNPADWDFVFAKKSQGNQVDSSDLLNASPISEWPVILMRLGWQTLEAACRALPHSVAKRFLLKLPVVSSLQPPSPDLALAMLHEVYPALVDQWNPEWDAHWLTASSKNR